MKYLVCVFLYTVNKCTLNFTEINIHTHGARDSGNEFCRFSDIRKETTLFLVIPKRNHQERLSYSVVSARNNQKQHN